MKDNNSHKIKYFLQDMVRYISIVVIGGLFLLCIFFETHVVHDWSEETQFYTNGARFIVCAFAGFVLLVILGNLALKVREEVLFIAFSAIYVLAGAYLILHVEPKIRADALLVFDNAIAIKNGDYSVLVDGVYLWRFPHQLGMVTYDLLFSFISEDVRFFFALNLVYILVINLSLWQITLKIDAQNKLLHCFTIILSFLFLPQFFYILFVYGLIPGVMLSLLSFCCFLNIEYIEEERFFTKRRTLETVGFILLLLFAVAIKKNCQVYGIAMIIVIICDYILTEEAAKKKVAGACLIAAVMLAMILPGKVLPAIYRNVTGSTVSDGTPGIMYIAMGLRDDENFKTVGGWYDDYVVRAYTEAELDNDVATKMAAEEIYGRISIFKSNPQYAFRFFAKKIISTWCDPTYESIWSGPLKKTGQKVYSSLLKSIYKEKSGYYALVAFCNVVNVVIFAGAFLGLILGGKQKQMYKLLPALYLLGGFTVHLIWETKSQYVYPYVVCLIPMSAYGLSTIGGR